MGAGRAFTDTQHAHGGWETHDEVKPKSVKDLLVLADRIAKPALSLTAAAMHLRDWLAGAMRLAPPLDVSYCLGPALLPMLPAPVLPDTGAAAVDLEPTTKPVRIGRAEGAKPKVTAASAFAKFVYPLAQEFRVTCRT